jgi:hypothetical protein
MIAFSDVYPASMGSSIIEDSVPDQGAVSVLSQAAPAPNPVSKVKSYNILSAVAVLILLMVLLQRTK